MNHSQPKRALERLVGHLEEERRLGDLAGVGGHRRPLQRDQVPDVDAVVMLALGAAEGGLLAHVGDLVGGDLRPISRPIAMIRRRWSRFIVASKTLGVPASSAARTPTRCTWMWSGCP